MEWNELIKKSLEELSGQLSEIEPEFVESVLTFEKLSNFQKKNELTNKLLEINNKTMLNMTELNVLSKKELKDILETNDIDFDSHTTANDMKNIIYETLNVEYSFDKIDEQDLNKMKVTEIKKILGKYNLKKTGKKVELVKRIVDFYDENDEYYNETQNKFIISEGSKPITSPKKKPVTSPKKKPVTSPKKKPVTSPKKKPVKSPKKKLVTTPKKKPVTTPKKESVKSPKKKPVKKIKKITGQNRKQFIDSLGENFNSFITSLTNILDTKHIKIFLNKISNIQKTFKVNFGKIENVFEKGKIPGYVSISKLFGITEKYLDKISEIFGDVFEDYLTTFINLNTNEIKQNFTKQIHDSINFQKFKDDEGKIKIDKNTKVEDFIFIEKIPTPNDLTELIELHTKVPTKKFRDPLVLIENITKEQRENLNQLVNLISHKLDNLIENTINVNNTYNLMTEINNELDKYS